MFTDTGFRVILFIFPDLAESAFPIVCRMSALLAPFSLIRDFK